MGMPAGTGGHTLANYPFVFDASQRYVEPRDLWSKRLPAKLKAAAPAVAPHQGGEAWFFEGGKFVRPLGLEVCAGKSPAELKLSGYSYAEIRKGCFDPKERLKDMTEDGIDAANIFPTFALSLRTLKDAAAQQACVRAYNEAVWEFCQTDAARLVPHALMPHTTLEAAMAEAKRAAKTGFGGVVFNGWPAAGAEPDPSEDSFWALCQDAGLVVNLVGGGPNISVSIAGMDIEQGKSAVAPEALWAGRASAKGTNMAWMVYTAVLDRFPNLKLALTETGAGWMPFYLETVDDIYRRSRFWAHPNLKYTPSEYIQRQVYFTIEGDRFAVRARHDMGVDHLLWASGYPGAAAARVWPSSRMDIADQFRSVPNAERDMMIGGNGVALYGLKAKVKATAR
ncbi:MAG: hypothetical protein EXR49_08235 [Dehalococcoidia bacterium]|nr:hypothetical protein [Dehalococcoidia bacterium]